MTMTDPNSLYRQVFSRDLSFFLYVIDHVNTPISIKLHVNTLNSNELADQDIHRSILYNIQRPEFGFWNSNDIAVEIKQFPNKNQIKIFLKVF